MTTTTTVRPAVLESVDSLDPFATSAVPVKGSQLREGMVLMDPDLGTPAAWLDTKQRTYDHGQSGSVAFLAHDLETHRLSVVRIFRNSTVRVLAKDAR